MTQILHILAPFFMSLLTAGFAVSSLWICFLLIREQATSRFRAFAKSPPLSTRNPR